MSHSARDAGHPNGTRSCHPSGWYGPVAVVLVPQSFEPVEVSSLGQRCPSYGDFTRRDGAPSMVVSHLSLEHDREMEVPARRRCARHALQAQPLRVRRLPWAGRSSCCTWDAGRVPCAAHSRQAAMGLSGLPQGAWADLPLVQDRVLPPAAGGGPLQAVEVAALRVTRPLRPNLSDRTPQWCGTGL